ncbi:MAG: hypothetical protein IJ461_02810, partial [Clostridia bacterium]|nr:hypothetical protein [Clostridia bacterium]
AAMNLKKLARWLGRFRLPFSLLSLFCFFLYEKPSSRFRENWVFLQAEGNFFSKKFPSRALSSKNFILCLYLSSGNNTAKGNNSIGIGVQGIKSARERGFLFSKRKPLSLAYYTRSVTPAPAG